MKKKKKKFQTNKSKTMFLNNPLWVVWSSFLKRKFKTCIKKHVLKKVLKNNTHAFYNRERYKGIISSTIDAQYLESCFPVIK